MFVLTRLVPGGPLERALNEAAMAASDGTIGTSFEHTGPGGSTLSEDQMEQMAEYYQFDKNPFYGYVLWLGNICRFNLGYSTKYHKPVWDIIRSRLPISLFYGVATLILTYGVCIPLGIVKAIKHRTVFDNISSAVVFTGYAIPSYVVAIALLTLFASDAGLGLGWFPLSGFVSSDFGSLSPVGKVLDVLYHAVLPLIAYVAGSFAFMTMLMKNSLMDNLAADYVRTAIAKGLNFRTAIFNHALRNSLIPIATSFGNNLSLIITGSFLIETIFNIDGFGLLGFESLVDRDYPVVMGIIVISSLLFLLGNILSDICVAIVDHRVKIGDDGSNQ